MNILIENADKDIQARNCLWASIRNVSYEIESRFRIKVSVEGDTSLGNDIPDLPTWRFVEALSLLCILKRAESISVNSIQIFGKLGPLKIKEDNTTHYIWVQHSTKGNTSSLGARPDIVITTTEQPPNELNTLRIIEAKCVRSLGTTTIRSEFGKAYDLRVASYFIWSFYSPKKKVIEGAKKLGIDLEVIGFDTPSREDLIRNPQILINHFVIRQEQSSRNNRFSNLAAEVTEQTRRKLLPP